MNDITETTPSIVEVKHFELYTDENGVEQRREIPTPTEEQVNLPN